MKAAGEILMQQHKQQNKKLSTKKLTMLALLLAIAFILSWIEYIISLPVIIPGIKIGLANLAILFTLYIFSVKETFLVLIGRLILNALLFGNALSLIYSFAGGILSFIVMAIFVRYFKAHTIATSICGGIFHNIGQIIAAFFVIKTSLVWTYLPYLIIGGIAAGAFNGIIVNKILKYDDIVSKIKCL